LLRGLQHDDSNTYIDHFHDHQYHNHRMRVQMPLVKRSHWRMERGLQPVSIVLPVFQARIASRGSRLRDRGDSVRNGIDDDINQHEQHNVHVDDDINHNNHNDNDHNINNN
jgi:hypothetical protein